MRTQIRRLAAQGVVVTVAAMAWGCGPRAAPPVTGPVLPEPPPVARAEPGCELTGEDGAPVTRVGVDERVDPAHAPHPTNDGERLIFRQLYETLVRLDCEWRLRPALATDWQRDPGGRWLVTLRDDARFSDGTAVTAASVRSWWSGGDPDGRLRADVSGYLQAIEIVDERTLAITLQDEAADEPAVLADPALAVARPVPDSPWPAGTRGTMVASVAADPDGRLQTIAIGPAGAVADRVGVVGAHVEFVIDPDRDPRDLLDAGVDLVVTRDPATLAYAATLPQVTRMPLPWHRTHVFVSRWREPSASSLPPELRERLARDAIRGDARGAGGPFWWDRWSECPAFEPPAVDRPSSAPPQVVYAQRDGAARDLAERLVGLVRGGGADAAILRAALVPRLAAQIPPRAAGLEGSALAAAQRAGADAGYILTVERQPLSACRAIAALSSRMPWLDPTAIEPLADTRRQAIVGRGRSGMTLEWDGTLLILPREVTP